ncbi:MAG: ABC transporter substrate-binding protein [bacterium]
MKNKLLIAFGILVLGLVFYAGVGFGAVELVVSHWPDDIGWFQRVVNGFMKENPDIKVKWEIQPGWSEAVNKFTTLLASGYSGVDAVHIDDLMTSTFGAAGWLEPLDDIVVKKFSIDLNDWPKTLYTDVSAWEGKLYRIPWGNDTRIWVYRKDWFDEAAVETPKTWDDLVQVGKKITREGRYLIGLPAKRGGNLGNEIQFWTHQAGGAINDWKNPGSAKAMEFYKKMWTVYKIAPESSPMENYSTINEGFQAGKYGIYNCWDGFLGSMRGNEKFWSSAKVSVMIPPKGPANGDTLTGTWGWSINKFSKHKSESALWVAYVSRPEVMRLQAERGRVPARRSLWADPEIQDKAPSAKYLFMYDQAGDIVKARPITPWYTEVLDAAEDAIHRYFTGIVDLNAAVKELQEKVGRIEERAKRR